MVRGLFCQPVHCCFPFLQGMEKGQKRESPNLRNGDTCSLSFPVSRWAREKPSLSLPIPVKTPHGLWPQPKSPGSGRFPEMCCPLSIIRLWKTIININCVTEWRLKSLKSAVAAVSCPCCPVSISWTNRSLIYNPGSSGPCGTTK